MTAATGTTVGIIRNVAGATTGTPRPREWFEVPQVIPHVQVSSWTLRGATSILLQNSEAADPDVEELFGSSPSNKPEAMTLTGRISAVEWSKLSFDEQLVHSALGAAPPLQLPEKGMLSTASQNHL
eukprot:6134471-Amphidinium_carterae.1